LDSIELKAKPRTKKGNGPARVLRSQGEIPAILYGPKREAVKLSIETVDLEKLLKTGSAGQLLFNLLIEGEAPRPVMIKELQQKAVTQEYLHIDLYEVDMKRKISATIPVTVSGKSVGVEMGGILQIIRRELDVTCLPNAIPDVIDIDITELNVGESVHVEDIDLEEGVEIPHEVNFTVVTIGSPKAAAEEEEEEEGEGEGEEGEAAEGEAEGDEAEAAEE
jgi:large subunit ribosomal protein L25